MQHTPRRWIISSGAYEPYVTSIALRCAKVLTAANGKRRRVYLRWATPFELFRELQAARITCGHTSRWRELDRFAQIQSDTEAALAMQRAKRKLFQSFQAKRTA